ncbi:MAG: penicillin-binding transpeptidase domain-containing protein, partial [Kiritimatiellia bacterium]|nr:penicillin-binding transpeptidase domain-containing protein [Kiritimatiellia bacterium]
RGRPLRDFSPHGRIPVRDVVRKSSNIGTAKLALRMSEARMEAYLRDFGFGRPTGIDLPREQVGIFRRHGVWDGLSQSRIAIGHAIGVTSLQVLNSVCAVANDGILMKPTVVSRIVDARGGRLAEFQPTILARPIREDTARLVLSLMADVTESGGTGTRAALPGYTIAGKTGTAEKPLPGGGYSTSLNIASFVGVLPASRPEIGIIVVIDEPKTQQTGGAVAAPVFRQIAENAVRVLNIPPDRPTPESRARRAQGGEVPRDPWTSM